MFSGDLRIGRRLHRNAPPELAARPAAAPASGRSVGRLSIHQRRRRVAGLVLVAALALILGLIVGCRGGGSGRRAPRRLGPRSGYFARIRTLAGTAPASFAVAEQAAENAAISRTLAYTPYVRVAGSQHREIALTFDDGPGPYTPQMLSVLEREHVPATFFEVGVLEQYFHASTAAIVARGYPIGDHTETHAPMSKLSSKQQQTQLLQETAAIGDYGAPFPRLFRPPYGLWNSTTLALLKKYRMLMVLWTVDTGDYQLPGDRRDRRTGRCRAPSRARSSSCTTPAATAPRRSRRCRSIIKGLRARGYKLVTVPRLLLDNPAPKDQDDVALAGSGR